MANPLSGRILSDLMPRLDRNRNQLIDSSEASVIGRVGNNNGFNGFAETAEALEAGHAALKDFRLSAKDADAMADRLAGGDAWVSKEDLYISDAARQRIDGVGGAADGKFSRTELSGALQRGGFALHQDGLFLSREMDERMRSGRPTPPPVSRPTPPAVDRPVPPSVDRPVPPALRLSPRAVSVRYQEERRALYDLYNHSGGLMSYSEFQRRDRDLIQGAVTDLVQGTSFAAYADRRDSLYTIYNGSGGNMSYGEFQRADRDLIRTEVDKLLMTPGFYPTLRRELYDVYNRSGGNMSYGEFQSADRELIRNAVEDVVRRPGSFDEKKRRLEEIYNTSGGNMSYSEYQAAQRRILDQSLNRL